MEQPKPTSSVKRALHGILDAHLIGLIPLAVLAAYWIGNDAVLFVVSFLFPLLVAVEALLPAPFKPAADGATTAPARVTAPADPLTGLPTRDAALSRLAEFLMAVRTSGRICAVLVVDIDRFQHINERFGIDAGDAILKIAAGRILETVRDDDVSARLAGDRFAVVLAPMNRAEFENVMAIAARLREALAAPIPLDQSQVKLSASIGICLAGRAPDNTASAMLQAAEEALAEVRLQGPGGIRNFSPRMRRESRRHRALSADLEAAFARGEFRAWFQPQIMTGSGAIAGFEALARWEHPDEGALPPERFLRALDAAEAAPALGEAMFAQALRALRTWDEDGFAIPSVSVNFSTSVLGDAGFCDRLRWEIDRQDVPPARVAIEIHETARDAQADDALARNLHGLKDFGFRLDLDDFGIGQAGIATIRRFRADRIKIDRSFVTGMDHDPVQRATVTAIVRLADTLGLDTVAEGVESRREIALLAEIGCTCVQGYAIGRPMPVAKTPLWIQSHGRSLQNRPPQTGTG